MHCRFEKTAPLRWVQPRKKKKEKTTAPTKLTRTGLECYFWFYKSRKSWRAENTMEWIFWHLSPPCLAIEYNSVSSDLVEMFIEFLSMHSILGENEPFKTMLCVVACFVRNFAKKKKHLPNLFGGHDVMFGDGIRMLQLHLKLKVLWKKSVPSQSLTYIASVYPPPSNSHKWRFIGIPY